MMPGVFINHFFGLCWVFIAVHVFSLVAAKGGYSRVAERKLLTAVASLVAEHGFQGMVFSYGTWASLPCGMWDLPRPGIEPVPAALAGRFLTTGPSGKSISGFLA